MGFRSRSLVGLAIGVVAFFVISTSLAAAGVAGVHFSPLLSKAGAPAPNVGVAQPQAIGHGIGSINAERMIAALNAAHVPPQERLLPTTSSGFTVRGGTLQPAYAELSAPMGIADYGVQKIRGHNVGTISYDQSIEGILSLNQLSLMYLQSAGPDEFTAQENAVLTGATVHGSSAYQFWTQNVIYYYQSTHTLHLADAIVNFSSPSAPAGLWNNATIGGNGYIAPGFGYFYPTGPTFTVAEPFTITFFENAAVVNDEPAIYFNYSLVGPHVSSSGSFDLVEFNATVTGRPSSPEPMPLYQINGQALGDTGYIPNDAELILGGDGGGSTTNVVNINGTMQLLTEAAGGHAYAPVPAAYDFGDETGETINGIAEWASGGPNPTVHLGPGPSIQAPLWGVVGAPAFGSETHTFRISPSNAFVFASPGFTFDGNSAVWAGPVPVSGTATYVMPRGAYTFRFLLSDFNPAQLTVGSRATSKTVTLTPNLNRGVYTPLWAWSNSQLAAISQPGGAGTAGQPFILDSNPPLALNRLFGAFNDYLFEVFSGIQLVNTTDYVAVYDGSSFPISYSLPWEQNFLGNALPLSNNLPMTFYGAEHVLILETPLITGWFFYANYASANVIFWNSSDNLVAGNSFQVESEGMYMFGGTNNTLWGNAFTLSVPPVVAPQYILGYGIAMALVLYESGDLIFNNAFVTPNTAVTPPLNPYDFNYVPELWTDTWNVSQQPASTVFTANGISFSGSILGLGYVGGNYWSNYGTPVDPFGVVPYNNGGQVTYHGDYLPVVPFVLYNITFTETGLAPPGTYNWSVTIDGYTQTTNTTSMTFEEPNGIYAFTVANQGPETPTPSIGGVKVNGANTGVSLTFA
jgi:thermopsin